MRICLCNEILLVSSERVPVCSRKPMSQETWCVDSNETRYSGEKRSSGV